jgi:hypothetical protein
MVTVVTALSRPGIFAFSAHARRITAANHFKRTLRRIVADRVAVGIGEAVLQLLALP